MTQLEHQADLEETRDRLLAGPRTILDLTDLNEADFGRTDLGNLFASVSATLETDHKQKPADQKFAMTILPPQNLF